VSRGRIWTAGELIALMALPDRTPEIVQSLALRRVRSMGAHEREARLLGAEIELRRGRVGGRQASGDARRQLARGGCLREQQQGIRQALAQYDAILSTIDPLLVREE